MTIREFLYRLKLRVTILYEKLLGIDFSIPIDPYNRGGGENCENVKYSASTRRVVKLFKKFKINPEDSFLDIGCGKGKVIDMMYKFPFKRIDGCEYSSKLCDVCRKNMAVRNRNKTVIYNSDIVNFKELDEYKYFYMFNPFVGIVMKCFLENLASSLKAKKRKIYIIYLNPKCHDILMETGDYEWLGSWRGFSIYTNI